MSTNRSGVLHVALDARPLTTSQAGVATYCRGLVYGLQREAGDDTRISLYAKDRAPDGLQLRSGTVWRAVGGSPWLACAVPRALHAGRINVFHGTNHMAPPFAPVPTVITVHDIFALTMPQHHTWRNRLLTVPQMLLSLRSATRIIAVSSSTARDLLDVLHIDEDIVRVIPEAPVPDLAPPPPEAVRDITDRLGLPKTFFLFLGGLGPNKNVTTALQAVAHLYATGESVRLVIAGPDSPHGAAVRDMIRRLGLEQQVQFIGFVDARDLPALYGAARALVYPSLFEGFGLPPLEAMACGTPVICSRTSSLPEVVGDAALLIDPRSVRELAEAMRAILRDDALCRQLQAAGRARAALFSWERTARETLDVYREAASCKQKASIRRYA